MRTFFILVTLPFLACQFAFSQSINPKPGDLYGDEVVPRIDILMSQDSLDALLNPANLQSDYEYHATFIFDNGTDRDTFQDVGFRLRGNTSRTSGKQSFKVSFNTYVSGRKYKGVEVINLNGEHNDPTLARSKVSWAITDTLGIAAARANHVNLYFNNQYRGVYLNVEHIDEEFAESRFGNKDGNLYKCLYPADLVFLGNDPDLYKLTNSGQRVYELKTNEDQDDYRDLARFIDILNNTPINSLRCSLEPVFNVDSYLKAIVMDILTGNWDGPIYNKNNFYLYHNRETDKFEYIPFDLDNTLGIDWLGLDWGIRNIYNWHKASEARPIYERLMQVPEYRDRFSYYMHEALTTFYRVSYLGPALDSIRTRIAPYLPQDTFYPRSYGFSLQDFQDGYSQALSYRHTAYGVMPFITTRRTEALNQLTLNDINPIVTEVENNQPTESQPVQVSARVRDDHGLNAVELCYHLGNPANLQCVPMYDDGLSGDGDAGDGVYGVILSPFNQKVEVSYQIRATDNQSKASIDPPCGYRTVFVGTSSLPLAINEFMASNSSTITDEAGEYEDWVEIHNYGNSRIYLGDKYLSDKQDEPTKWNMPDIWIEPGDFLLFWTDSDPPQGPRHTNFKLSKDGEFIGIFEGDAAGNVMIDGVAFPAQRTDTTWGRVPNGTGGFSFLDPTPAASNTPASLESEMAISVQVGPNPFRDELHLRVETEGTVPLSLVLTDLLGRTWMEVPVQTPATTHKFNMAQLPTGMYIMQLRQENRLVHSRKMLKTE